MPDKDTDGGGFKTYRWMALCVGAACLVDLVRDFVALLGGRGLSPLRWVVLELEMVVLISCLTVVRRRRPRA